MRLIEARFFFCKNKTDFFKCKCTHLRLNSSDFLSAENRKWSPDLNLTYNVVLYILIKHLQFGLVGIILYETVCFTVRIYKTASVNCHTNVIDD